MIPCTVALAISDAEALELDTFTLIPPLNTTGEEVKELAEPLRLLVLPTQLLNFCLASSIWPLIIPIPEPSPIATFVSFLDCNTEANAVASARLRS